MRETGNDLPFEDLVGLTQFAVDGSVVIEIESVSEQRPREVSRAGTRVAPFKSGTMKDDVVEGMDRAVLPHIHQEITAIGGFVRGGVAFAVVGAILIRHRLIMRIAGVRSRWAATTEMQKGGRHGGRPPETRGGGNQSRLSTVRSSLTPMNDG
jgi:hypothetical protein